MSKAAVFCLLAFFALTSIPIILQVTDPKTSLEYFLLASFSAIGAVQATLAESTRRINQNHFPICFRLGYYPAHIPLLWAGAGFLLSGGGGLMRRGIEIVSSKIFTLPECYASTIELFLSLRYYHWVGLGIILGALSSVIVLFNPAYPNVVNQELNRLITAVDRFGSAFFAAYGMEAAIKLTPLLPLPAGLKTLFGFLVISAAITLPFGLITAAGGGLLTNVVTDAVNGRIISSFRTLRVWICSLDVKKYAIISMFAWVFYQAIRDTHIVFGQCNVTDEARMYMLACVSAVTGFALWIR